MAELLRGKPVADKIREEIAQSVSIYKAKGIEPKAAIVRVGNKPDDIAYERHVVSDCEKLGIATEKIYATFDISTEELMEIVERLNSDESIHGILIFRPLPAHIDYNSVCRAIKPEKDIDCMNPLNLEKLFIGDRTGIAPCTPEAVIELLKFYGYELRGKNVTVVNRSLVIGKPLAMLLLNEDATVTVCHSKTTELYKKTSSADIFISGIGTPRYFGAEYVSEKTTVVDVGINFENGKMYGDMNFEEVSAVAKAVTPVPGGVGSVTSMLLIKHIIKAVKLITGE